MPRDDDAQIQWDGRKWPDRLHWQFTMRRLGEDEHGTWLSVPAGTVVRRGHEAPRVLDHGFVSLIDEDEFAENQVRLAYPPELIAGARQAADEVTELLRRRIEPFGTAARRWLAGAGEPEPEA